MTETATLLAPDVLVAERANILWQKLRRHEVSAPWRCRCPPGLADIAAAASVTVTLIR